MPPEVRYIDPPTPNPTSAQGLPLTFGNWYQDLAYETSLNAFLESEGINSRTQVVTMDAALTGWGPDLSLSLGCITGLAVAYLSPYSYVVPQMVDTYVVGVWDREAVSWVHEDLGRYHAPVITDDGSAIYVTNRTQLLQIVAILRTANENQHPNLILSAGMFDSRHEDVPGLWGQFDPTGLDKALRYLTCLR